jgi:RNA polymerase sigma-70 factor (ECF subfamily)
MDPAGSSALLSAVSAASPAAVPALDPDVRLMLAVAADDANAFEELVRRYQPRLVTVMRYLLHRDDQVEDLVQEVFLRVFRARKNYQPTARFATWIFHIAQNVAKNARRTLARRKEVPVPTQQDDSRAMVTLDQLAQEASALMPARQLDRSEIGKAVQDAMQLIGERQRMALLLCKFEGMSYEEVAETMELTIPAVKSLINRGRTSLRDALQPYFCEGRPVATPGTRSQP